LHFITTLRPLEKGHSNNYVTFFRTFRPLQMYIIVSSYNYLPNLLGLHLSWKFCLGFFRSLHLHRFLFHGTCPCLLIWKLNKFKLKFKKGIYKKINDGYGGGGGYGGYLGGYGGYGHHRFGRSTEAEFLFCNLFRVREIFLVLWLLISLFFYSKEI
jgi:hypothetical protein